MFHLQETRECCKTPVLNRGHFGYTWGALRIAVAVVWKGMQEWMHWAEIQFSKGEEALGERMDVDFDAVYESNKTFQDWSVFGPRT